jgi:hypothetical protein
MWWRVRILLGGGLSGSFCETGIFGFGLGIYSSGFYDRKLLMHLGQTLMRNTAKKASIYAEITCMWRA